MKKFMFILLFFPLFAAAQEGLPELIAEAEISNVLLTEISANTENDHLRAFYIGSTVGEGNNCTSLLISESGAVILIKQSISAPLMYWLAIIGPSSSTPYQITATRETLLEAKADLLLVFNEHNETEFTLVADCNDHNAILLGL